jgi:hypothetical protein
MVQLNPSLSVSPNFTSMSHYSAIKNRKSIKEKWRRWIIMAKLEMHYDAFFHAGTKTV